MSYERLEFLGDSVLELSIARTLYDAHPDFQLIFPVRGSVVFASGGREHRVRPPGAILLWPDTPHAMHAPEAGTDLLTLQVAPGAEV